MDERLIKKKPIHIHQEFPEHEWTCDEDGNINEFAMEFDYHNGPACKRCDYTFCIHCDPNGWNKKPCIIDENHCPNCNRYTISSHDFCPYCGQALDWSNLNE